MRVPGPYEGRLLTAATGEKIFGIENRASLFHAWPADNYAELLEPGDFALCVEDSNQTSLIKVMTKYGVMLARTWELEDL